MRQVQRLFRAGVDDRHRAVADLTPRGGEFAGELGLRRFQLARRRAMRRRSPPCRGGGPPAGERRRQTVPAVRFDAAEEAGHLVERALGGGQADALRRASHQRREPLDRQREVGAALGRHQGVDLVDDDRLDRAQRLAGVRRQQQIERFRRGDQDVGRLALEARPLGGGRVAGADGDRRRDEPIAARRGDLRDAGQRRAEVALDVDRQRLERRDVEHAAARGPRRRPANIRRSRHHRNAVSVLPLPVGARISVESPRAIAGQPSVAAGSVPRTRRRTTRARPDETARADQNSAERPHGHLIMMVSYQLSATSCQLSAVEMHLLIC